MIGIVVVSHSRPLAQAAVELASQMVPGDSPRIAVAAGLDDGGFGTDAAAISLAIGEVDSPDGVLVLIDLGSALLSSELAIEFLDPDIAERVRISPAPLVEGLLAAVVQAATGAPLDEVDREARDALVAKAGHINGDEQPAELLEVPRPAQPQPAAKPMVWRTTVRNPHGIHVRPAAAIVAELRDFDAEVLLANATTGRGPAPANSLSRITALEVGQHQILEARFSGPAAERAREALAELASRDFGEDMNGRPKARATAANGAPASTNSTAEALAASPAAEHLTVVGPVVRATSRPSIAGYRAGAPKKELVRFTESVARVDDFLAEIASSGVGIPGIIEAQRMMLADRELHHGVVGIITAGFSAVDAVDQHLTETARSFDQFADNYLRERGQDVRSLRRMLLLALMGQPLTDQEPDRPSVWVMDELDAATAMRLDPRTCLGVVTIMGGSSGHGMLAAQARGIPVLTGQAGASQVPDGQVIAFDPVSSQLWLDPDEQLRSELAQRNAERIAAASQAQERAHEPALTTDGTRVPVEANIGSVDEALIAAHEGAEGAGIVRTEVLFSTARTAPSVAEQAEVFVRIGKALNAPITIRTWDPAGDKPLAFLPYVREDNPALGQRGVRAMRAVPEILRDQLRAIIQAARQVEVRVLLPMVTTPEEVTWVRGLLDEARAELDGPELEVGVMVEVPAVALRAADFAGVADFFSVGTNDLTQYTQAADRTNAAVRGFARQDTPAVLDLIRATCAALPNHTVSVCGDLASDPAATATLLGMGVRALSVRPRMVAEVKQAVRLV